MDSNQQQKQFVSFFKSLPEKPATTIRFFNKGEYYSVHGSDALFAAKEIFGSTAFVKTIGSGDLTCESQALNKSQFEALVRDLLLVKQYRVEVFNNKGSKSSCNWNLEFRGSPGNLSQFEDILFANNDQVEGTLIAAIKVGGDSKGKIVGVALVDPTEFKFSVTEFSDNEALLSLESLLVHVGPKECLLMGNPTTNSNANVSLDSTIVADNNILNKIVERCGILVTQRKKKDFDNDSVMQDLSRLVKFAEGQQANANNLPEASKTLAISAMGALIKYLELMTDSECFGKYALTTLESGRFVHLDNAALIALSVVPPAQGSGPSGVISSIQSLLDKCRTSHGRRMLSQWVKQPLKDANIISERHDIVAALMKDTLLRQELHSDLLHRVPDFQALGKRLLRNKATLQDCYRIYQGIKNVSRLNKSLEGIDPTLTSVIAAPLADLLIDMEKFLEMVESTIDMDLVDKGEFLVKPEFDTELQELRQKMDAIEEDLESELKRVGRDLALEVNKALKLESNSQHGYFFRVTLKDEKAIRNNKEYEQLDATKAGVRFRSKKLTSLNSDHAELKEEYSEQQATIVKQVVEIAVGYWETVSQISSMVATLDVLTSFSVVSASAPGPYIRPTMTPMGSGDLKLIQVRHPLVECIDSISYIPNDVIFDKDNCKFILVTGPNMGGKSTYMKSAGCAVLMAHIGCFVPAKEATIPIVDAIFARVGAADSHFKGMSTFMMEMVETTAIIKNATENSLVIIDELGRGTSTYDGCGIAWAIAEYLANDSKAMCLFATHFHELTSLADTVTNLKNVHTKAVVRDGQLTLLYQVADGVCDQSFGIHVAEMARFPDRVILDAKRKLIELEDFRGALHCEGGDSKKRQIMKEGDDIMDNFVNACKALPISSMSKEDIMAQVKKLKEVALNKNNGYVNLIVEKSCAYILT